MEQLEALQAQILAGKVGLQDIRGDVYTSPFGRGQIELPRSFTFLGQKFVLDSWVTAKIVFDDVLWNEEKVQRRVPSCLDVAFAALGNDQVVPLLVDRMVAGTRKFRIRPTKENRLNFQHYLAAARNVVDAQQPTAWEENLYMGWLATLRELSKPTTDSKYPEVLRTGLGHEISQRPARLLDSSAPRYHLVCEAVVHGGNCLRISGRVCGTGAALLEPAGKNAAAGGRVDGKNAFPQRHVHQDQWEKRSSGRLQNPAEGAGSLLAQLRPTVGTLKTIAGKQLEQKELTAEETKFLKEIVEIRRGSGITRYNGWYPKLFWKGPEDSAEADALVADVHTNVPAPMIGDPGCVLHQGVGNIDLMLIAIDNGKDRMVYAGPVMSHYEFEMTGTVRKADSEWRKDLEAGRVPPRPEWTQEYLVPHVNPPAKGK